MRLQGKAKKEHGETNFLDFIIGESHPSNCPCNDASANDQEIHKFVLVGTLGCLITQSAGMKGQELQDYKQLDLRVCNGP